MRDRPDKPALLRAVAAFLEGEVRPALAGARDGGARDPSALAFRVLIASHLTALVAAETEAEAELDRRELEGLRGLLPDFVPPETLPGKKGDPRAAHRAYSAELAARIRAGSLSPDDMRRATDHVLATLRDELSVTSPKFSTNLDIP